MARNDWEFSGYPFIPGHEVVGVVHVAGPRAPASLKPGTRVGVGWIKNSCRLCPACLRGEENICREGYTGLITAGGRGGFSSRMRVPSAFVYPIPAALRSADAAPLLCAGITVYAPLKRWLRPGMRVAILGCGGLGHLAVQFAAAMGGIVTAVDLKETKRAEAQKFGASAFMSFDAALGEESAGAFDLVLNTVPVKLDIPKILGALAPGGTLVQIGMPGGGAAMKVPLLGLVCGQKRVVGSIVGGRADMQSMLEFAAAKAIRPMVETMRLCDVNKAMRRLEEGDAHYRIVLLSPGVADGDEARDEKEEAEERRATTGASPESPEAFL